MRPGELALIAPIRWGASEVKIVPAFDPVTGILGRVDVKQFTDFKLLLPQQLALALYATAPAPVAGLTVEWTVTLGIGSTSTDEVFSAPVQDQTAQAPISLLRPASTVRIAARLTSTDLVVRGVKLVVMIAPTSPIWSSDLTCKNEPGEDW